MSKTVIQVEHLSKAYRIGVAEKKSDTIAGAIFNAIKSPIRNFKQLRNLRSLEREEDSVSWALKDINFEVKEGEVLGIIGHNGAGKSTLLKILSRITEPTEGRVTIHGRVSSLLEVGTGFHPDLTGRENIYMNGTILGMRKKEIDARLDEIIAFSGINKYIDTPVKRYSSGMTVRLAFSVAAHLEPEILIIDEVLAVGDADFQKKCVGKMNQVADGGRTILFVSHNLKLVESLCSRTLVLNDGRIAYSGETRDSLQFYKSEIGEALPAIVIRNAGVLDFVKVNNKESLQDLVSNQDLTLNLLFTAHQTNINFYCDIGIHTPDDVKIAHSRSTWRYDSPFKLQQSGDFELNYSVKNLNLAPGRYFIEVYIYSGSHVFYYAKNIDAFRISSKNFHGGSLSMDHVNAYTVPEFDLKVNK